MSLILPDHPRILVIRADRLGDVILSIPTMEVLKRTYPGSHLGVMVQPQVAPALRGLPFIDEIIEIMPDKIAASELQAKLKQGKWDLAVVLQPRLKILWALRRAGVALRLGPYSKWYSFLLLTHGIRQRRSRVEMHEADYNLRLLSLLGIDVGTRTVLPKVLVGEEARREVEAWWESCQVAQQGPENPVAHWIAIHPGMGGSALNWPENHYIGLAHRIMDAGHGVIVTGGPAEQPILDRFEGALRARFGARLRIFGGSSAPDIQRLGAVFEKASVVVAPSTGPLHLASALARRVVSFYPPIRVQSALRWGPYVSEWPGREDESAAAVLVPEVHCGQEYKCRGKSCAYFPCMSTLSVTQALELVQNHLKHQQTT